MTVRDIGEVFLAVVVIGIQVLFLSSATGVVREHCLASQPANLRDVESSWTYVIWPPVVFSAVDPPGRCVRNTVGREVLGKTGIWPLGTPAEQVEEHLREQLERAGGPPHAGLAILSRHGIDPGSRRSGRSVRAP